MSQRCCYIKDLRLDILPKVSKFLGARAGDTQTDKSLKRWEAEHLQGLQCSSFSLALYCAACFSWKNTTAALIPEVVALCLVCSHYPLSHLTSGAARVRVQAHRAVLSPLPCPQPEMCWHSQDAQGHSFLSSHPGKMEDQPLSLDELHPDNFHQ